ncbi:MAG: hypothetical protein IJ174_04765, partial [Clostridia bacterium]|nr:hypothetical protein [Clostridia bacterium]
MKMSDYTLSMANKFFSILIGLLSSVFYIRYLGIEFKGTYSYIGEVAGVATILLTLGLHQSYAWQYRQGLADRRGAYGRVFAWQFLILTVLCAILCICFRADALFVLIVCQLPVLVLRSELESVMLVENLRAYLISDMVFKSVLCILYFILWRFFPVSLAYLVYPVLTIRFLECIFWIRAARLRLGKADPAFLRAILRFGFLPMLSLLLVTFNYTLDIFFLKQLGTAEELSVYTLSALIINYVWVIPNAFKEVLTSKFARANDEDAVRLCVKCPALLTVFVLIAFALVGKPLIGLIFGEAFSSAWQVTLILFIGAFPMILYKMMGVVFLTEGKRILYFVPLLI